MRAPPMWASGVTVRSRLKFGDGPAALEDSKRMIAVIGNVIAGLGVVSLFTATLRLTRPRK